MQAQLKQEFERLSCGEHPFVKELYRKARNAAKTYDKTIENQEKAKVGYKLTTDQKEKVRNLEDNRRCVSEAIETLALFDKHYQDPNEPNKAKKKRHEVVQYDNLSEEEVGQDVNGEWLDQFDAAFADDEPKQAQVADKRDQAADAKTDLEEEMRILAAVYKLGASNINFLIQIRANQESEISKLNLPLNMEEFFVLQMFYNFTFSTLPSQVQVGANNSMDSYVSHIATHIRKLVEGSQQELPFNPLYTYAKLKDLYLRAINSDEFMQDPSWTSQPSMGMGAPMMQLPQMPMFPAAMPQQMAPQMQMQMTPNATPIGYQSSDPRPQPDTPMPPNNPRDSLQSQDERTRKLQHGRVDQEIEEEDDANEESGVKQEGVSRREEHVTQQIASQMIEAGFNQAQYKQDHENEARDGYDNAIELKSGLPEDGNGEEGMHTENGYRGRGTRGYHTGTIGYRGRGKSNYYDGEYRGGRGRGGRFSRQEGEEDQGGSNQYYHNNFRARGRGTRGRGGYDYYGQKSDSINEGQSNTFFRNRQPRGGKVDEEGFETVQEKGERQAFKGYQGRQNYQHRDGTDGCQSNQDYGRGYNRGRGGDYEGKGTPGYRGRGGRGRGSEIQATDTHESKEDAEEQQPTQEPGPSQESKLEEFQHKEIGTRGQLSGKPNEPDE